MQSFGSEKGVVFRPPATANLMVDSADRNDTLYLSPWDFQITNNQALINGFFSRIGATEMVLEWNVDNVSLSLQNTTVIVDISGTGGNTHNDVSTIDISGGFLTAEDAIKNLVAGLNGIAGTGTTFTINQLGGSVELESTGGVFKFQETKLIQQLGIDYVDDEYANFANVQNPDLRPYRYLDFVCENLTAVQDVKDSSTQLSANRNVLLRWYFAEDTPEQVDGYGFPILQGYTGFVRRRIYNPPKQIRWEQNLPVGNLSFQVYGPDGKIPTQPNPTTEWLMTLQLSEN
jgi:hypothetical protein